MGALRSRTGGFVDLENSMSMPNEHPKLGESGGKDGLHYNEGNHDNDDNEVINDEPQTTGSSAQRLGHSSSTMSLVDGVSGLE